MIRPRVSDAATTQLPTSIQPRAPSTRRASLSRSNCSLPHQCAVQERTPRTHEMNTLYDLPGQKLRRRGELLRLRQYGDRWKRTHKAKGSTGRHKSRAETETSVADGRKMDGILRALGFGPSF